MLEGLYTGQFIGFGDRVHVDLYGVGMTGFDQMRRGLANFF
jgi:hypothetical protein